MKSSTNNVSEEDMKKYVTEKIEIRLQERAAEEEARKSRRNNIIIFQIKEN